MGREPTRIESVSSDGKTLLLSRHKQIQCQYPWLADSFPNIELTTAAHTDSCDVILGKDPENKSLFKEVRGNIVERTIGVYFNYRQERGRDERFRKAISLGIDRKNIAEKDVVGIPCWDIVPSHMKKSPLKKPERNLELAQSLLNEIAADYKDKTYFKVPIGDRQTVPQWMELLKDNLAECGLGIEYINEEIPFNFEGKDYIPFILVGFIPSLSTPLEIFDVFKEGGGWVQKLNEPDDKYESYLWELRTESLDEKRASLEQLLSERFAEKAYAIPIMERPPLYYYKKEKRIKLRESEQSLYFYLDKISLSEEDFN